MPAEAISAFRDNYLWLMSGRGSGVMVDPGDAEPVIAALESRGLTLSAILITHHHSDHIGGVAALRAVWPEVKVFGPEDSRIPADFRVSRGMKVNLGEWGLGAFDVLDVPGHTRSHIAYYGGGDLYCGDTLFVCGCGRLFEGTPKQMHASLSKIRLLPEETRVYCGHEYTLDNVQFALWVEPENADLRSYQATAKKMREAGTPTVPSTIGFEKKCNPFLRFDTPEVVEVAQRRTGREDLEEYEVFGEIRHWKDTEFD